MRKEDLNRDQLLRFNWNRMSELNKKNNKTSLEEAELEYRISLQNLDSTISILNGILETIDENMEKRLLKYIT